MPRGPKPRAIEIPLLERHRLRELARGQRGMSTHTAQGGAYPGANNELWAALLVRVGHSGTLVPASMHS